MGVNLSKLWGSLQFLIPSLPIVFRFLKDTLAIDASQHHVVDARPAMLSSCSWHKNQTLVVFVTEFSAVSCGEESKTCPADSQHPRRGLQEKVWVFLMEEECFPKSLQNAKENLIGVLENKTEFFIQHKANRPTSNVQFILFFMKI